MHSNKKTPKTISGSISFNIIVWTTSILFILFFIVPILRLLLYDSPRYLLSQFLSPVNLEGIKITLLAATVSTVIVVIFGFPLAYILARYQFIGKKMIDAIVELPIMIPHTVVGIALLLVFAKSEPAGPLLSRFGLSFGAIVMAYMFVSGTYAIKTMEEAIKSVHPRIELVARTLGASQWQVVRMIIIPQISRSILTGGILSWGRAMSEVAAIMIVAPYVIPTYHQIAGIEVYNQFVSTGMKGAVGLSAVLIIISLIILIVLKVIQYQKIFYMPGVER